MFKTWEKHVWRKAILTAFEIQVRAGELQAQVLFKTWEKHVWRKAILTAFEIQVRAGGLRRTPATAWSDLSRRGGSYAFSRNRRETCGNGGKLTKLSCTIRKSSILNPRLLLFNCWQFAVLSLESVTALHSLYDIGRGTELIGNRQHLKAPLPDGSNLSLMVTHPHFSSPVELWLSMCYRLSEGHPIGDYEVAQIDISREPANKEQTWFMGSYGLYWNPFMLYNPPRWEECKGGWRAGKEHDELALSMYGPNLPLSALAVFSEETFARLFPEHRLLKIMIPAA